MNEFSRSSVAYKIYDLIINQIIQIILFPENSHNYYPPTKHPVRFRKYFNASLPARPYIRLFLRISHRYNFPLQSLFSSVK